MQKYRLVVLPCFLRDYLATRPEKKMGGFQTGSIYLRNGTEFKGAFSNATYLHYVDKYDFIPFGFEDIEKIIIDNLDLDFAAYARVNQRTKWGLLIDVLDPNPEPQNFE